MSRYPTEMKDAILVTLDRDTEEIEAISKSAGYKIKKAFFQYREKPDVNTYVGRGKIKEIKSFIEENGANLIIINGELRPSQWFKLEKEFGREVYDRVRLILALFEKRAESKEAKLQVRLAQLQYERPFVRELIHRARAGEHPGFMAGGEYQVDDYYEMIKRQMKDIRKKLEKVRKDRELRRKHRYEAGFYLIAIAGYTNAGKSSLLNLLSEERLKVEEMLFSTLSPTTRRLSRKFASAAGKPPLLFTDTVGFIKDLPAVVIDAFHSTLEEIAVADLILLMVDISEPLDRIKIKLQTSFRELKEISAEAPVIFVFNKIDRISEREKEERLDCLKEIIDGKPCVCISVERRQNIESLLKLISKNLPSLVEVKMTLPLNSQSQRFVSLIHERAWIVDIKYSSKIMVHFAINQRMFEKIEKLCKETGGRIIIAK